MATAEEIDNRRRSPRESVAPLPPSCHLADVENQLGPTFLTRYSLSSLSPSLARLCLYEKKREEEEEEVEQARFLLRTKRCCERRCN